MIFKYYNNNLLAIEKNNEIDNNYLRYYNNL